VIQPSNWSRVQRSQLNQEPSPNLKPSKLHRRRLGNHQLCLETSLPSEHTRGAVARCFSEEFCPFREPGSNWTTSQFILNGHAREQISFGDTGQQQRSEQEPRSMFGADSND
jgi:hypothetical protein